MEMNTSSNVNAMSMNTAQSKMAKAEAALFKVGVFVEKYAPVIVCVLLLSLMASGIVGAADGDTAETLWTTMIGLVKKWVTRLGGLIMVVGGIMFGIGWQRDDASAKTTGMSTFVGGAIVVAVVQLITTFAA